MCRTYLLSCPACDHVTNKAVHCAELTARRSSHPTDESNTKPTRSDCATYDPAADPSKTTVFFQAPIVQRCLRHCCANCGFWFWYAVDEEDEGGEEVTGEGELALEVRAKRAEGRRRAGMRRVDRVEAA